MEQQPTIYTPSICSFRMPFSGGGGDGDDNGENWRHGFEHGADRFEKHSAHAGKWAGIFTAGALASIIVTAGAGITLTTTGFAALPAAVLVAGGVATVWCAKKTARCLWSMDRSNQYAKNKIWKGTPHKEPRMKKPSWFKGWFNQDWGVGQKANAPEMSSFSPHDLES